MADICQNVLDGFGISSELALSIVVPIFRGTVAAMELYSFLRME